MQSLARNSTHRTPTMRSNRTRTSGPWHPLQGRHKPRRGVVRTVCIFQLLGILTCSGLLTTLWLMARLEASYNQNEFRMLMSDPYPSEELMIQKELEETMIRNPHVNSWSPPISNQRQPQTSVGTTNRKPTQAHTPARTSPRVNRSNHATALPPSLFFPALPPSLEYLGVMIDAGRHFFPLAWLYQQLEHFHNLGYNYIHFRLTDDQNFVLNITIPRDCLGESSSRMNPETTTSMAFVARQKQEEENHFDPNGSKFKHSGTKNPVMYQPEELSEFVRFAKSRYNITVIPEVNLPGHAGAWGTHQGLQDLVVSCPEFACSKGYGIPLNVTHPKLPKLLKHVLTTVVEIFDHPPLLHLGGDELHMSIPCLEEAGIENSLMWLQEAVLDFENQVLGPILQGLGYGPNQILRWENKHHKPQTTFGTAQEPQRDRFGGITHYWETIPSAGIFGGAKRKSQPYVISTGMYLDVLWYDRPYGYGDFLTAETRLTFLESNPPLAMVVGTFELGMEFWEDRNVLGRLLAIRMGVQAAVAASQERSDNSTIPRTQIEFKKTYISQCNAIFSKQQIPCENAGWPLLDGRSYDFKWKRVWREWKDGVCEYVFF